MNQGHYAEAYELLHDGILPNASSWSKLCATQQAGIGSSRHWEFVAIALLHRFDYTDKLAPEIHERLLSMQPFWHARHESMNFRLMRAVAEARLDGRLLRASDLAAIDLSSRSDGALPDGDEGVSTQYHAYMLLLLVRWGSKQDEILRRIIENGFAWLHGIWRRYGDPSPLGRGRFQLFGYAALAAGCYYANCWGINQPEGYIAHIHDRLLPEQPNGALSARWSGPFRDALLHGYNTPDDYRAFAAFWTADIPKISASMATGVFVRYPLDHFGSCLIANGNGPLVAITMPPLTPPEDKGRKRELREALRNILRKPRYVENLSPEILTETGFRLGDIHCYFNGKRFTMEFSATPFFHSPIIWTLEGTPLPEIEGAIEMNSWSWSRTNMPAWCGNSFRIFGGARLIWLLR